MINTIVQRKTGLWVVKYKPVPSPQLLKLFVEDFLVTRKNLPSTKSVCDQFISFTSYWERATCRTLSNAVKKDVLNVCPSTAARAEPISLQTVYQGEFDKEL